ncbi:MKL/myocardin-like protein 2 [Leptotrombidium deliense]|uniref:MKL/myocardin-like protein 2 n=1 Tax=Leptotrombidium deliense TaxID=299467 RepID=A0A443ST55_9ACAR|nr:MKL/myocardin-like protein 2 [Leptotrombidium deliense]
MTDESGQSYISVLDSNHSLDSPPNIDEASIQKSMDKNKESLKVKLMLRRPISQLVEQGIIPPLKTSPVFYEQSKKLERARMGDFLKHKIQRRPDRQLLIEQHILEDTTVSPSLHDKQRQLKKARLADDLNDRLSHRPGPLELVKGNILLTDERFAQAVKEGQIQFKATSEGEAVKHPPPRFVLDESSSDDAASPPQDSLQTDKEVTSDCSVTLINHESPTSASILLSSSPASVILSPPSVSQQTYSIRSLTPASVVTTIASVASATPVSPSNCAPLNIKSANKQVTSSGLAENCVNLSSKELPSAGIVPKSRKKSKSKAQPKTKTIKFHEYKGPPNAQKKQCSTSDSSESSYELLLKQQQLFLQWQLEWQQKYPQIILPAAQKPNSDQTQGTNPHNFNTSQIQNLSQTPLILTQNRNSVYSNCDVGNNGSNPFNVATVLSTSNGLQVPSKSISKLEDMKVSDLKIELKKRNLPVSGAKPQLIERLKPFFDDTGNQKKSINVIVSNGVVVKSNANVSKTNEHLSEISSEKSEKPELNSQSDSQSSKESTENSPLPMEVDATALMSHVEVDTIENNNGDELLLLQQKRIEELQKELQRSQLQLHIHNPPVYSNQPQSVAIPFTTIATPQIQFVSTPAQTDDSKSSDSRSLQRQLLQQHLQQKLQQQTSPLQTLISTGNASAADQLQQQIIQIFKQIKHLLFMLNKNERIHCRTLFNTNLLHRGIVYRSVCTDTFSMFIICRATSLPNFSSLVEKNESTEKLDSKPPPDYDEATKNNFIPTKSEAKSNSKCRIKKKSFKSQAVDDVLEILIKNGELPPSAAQEPATPTTPEKMSIKNKQSVSQCQGSQKPQIDECDLKPSDVQNDFNIDFDFSMELQELADSMDFSSLVNEGENKVLQNVDETMNSKLVESSTSNTPGSELSLSEFIDFQESSMNVDEAEWLRDMVMPLHTNNNAGEELKRKNFVVSNNNLNLRCQQVGNSKREPSLSTENGDHDPLLANSIVDSSRTDPLIDLFFDENDYKPCNDIGVLVWEKCDFTV